MAVHDPKLTYSSTPIIAVETPGILDAGVVLHVKREDLNHPFVSGNKWWKLRDNLTKALASGHTTLLTFGGAFSNHIYATAAAAKYVGLKSVGVIRGECSIPMNPTLKFAQDAGMQLHFVSREKYRDKDTLARELTSLFGNFYLIPEGGSNEQGVAGVAAFAETLPGTYDFVCSPIGTGATAAGLVRGLKGKSHVLGFPVLQGGMSWQLEVSKFNPLYDNWSIIPQYHFGGYAKSHPDLAAFISDFSGAHNIPLEHVYSGKMCYGIFDLIKKGFFARGSRILAIHTGGVGSNMNSL